MLLRRGIGASVSARCPLERAAEALRSRALVENPDLATRRVEATPLRRVGTPADVAGAVVYLASPASSFVAGHALVIDGGTSVTDGT